MEREEETARRSLAAVAGIGPARAAAARFTRLVGFTNRVYRVDFEDDAVCLRIPGTGAAALIDRRVERRNARLAADAGVAPEVIHFGGDGVMVTRFINASVPLSPDRMRESSGALERAAEALRRLHESGAEFAGRFDPFTFVERYLGILVHLGVGVTTEQRRCVEAVQALSAPLGLRPPSLKACHCDPTGRNMLDDGRKVWLVDWEFSAMNDPMWDLAYVSIESRFDDAGDKTLVGAYFGAIPSAQQAARMTILKPVAEVVAALWALIQAAEGVHAGDFSGYAERAFASAAKRMTTSNFSEALARMGLGGA